MLITSGSKRVKKRLWTSIFDDCRPKFVFKFVLCTAIFYQHVRSMHSKEWLQTIYAFKFFCQMFSILVCMKQGACEVFFCKMCIQKHSDKPVLDPNWNLQKCNLRKCIASSLTALNTFLWIWNSSEAFESNCWRKCLWDGSLVSCFCQLTPNFEFCCFHLSYCFCLLCFTAVNTKEQFQKLKGR